MSKARRAEKKVRMESLRRVPVFTDLTDEQLGRIDSMMTEVSVKEGEHLVREGGSGLQFLIILEGKAKVTIKGREVAEVGPGSFVGEMAMLSSTPRGATVTALTPMDLYVFDPGQFADLLKEAPSVREMITKEADERVRENVPPKKI